MSRYRLSHKGVSIGITDLKPFRKSLALTVVRGNSEEVLAYFRDEASAKVFEGFISGLPLPLLEDSLTAMDEASDVVSG